MGELLDQLVEWLRIPSISTGGGKPEDLRRAAEWAAAHVERAGGSVELVQIGDGNPIVVGDLRAAPRRRADGPHLRPLRRAERRRPRRLDVAAVRARGARRAPLRARRLRRQGQLLAAALRGLRRSRAPASCRSTCAWSSRARRRPAPRRSPSGSAPTSAAPTRRSCSTPGWSTSRRRRSPSGCAAWRWRRSRCAPAPATCTPACTAAASSTRCTSCTACSPRSSPARTASLRDELRAGIVPPAEAERISWERLPPGDEVIAEVGGREAYPGAAAEYYERNGADASLDVNEIVGGEPRTVVPARRARRRSRSGSRPASGRPRSGRCSSACCATRRRPAPR